MLERGHTLGLNPGHPLKGEPQGAQPRPQGFHYSGFLQQKQTNLVQLRSDKLISI